MPLTQSRTEEARHTSSGILQKRGVKYSQRRNRSRALANNFWQEAGNFQKKGRCRSVGNAARSRSKDQVRKKLKMGNQNREDFSHRGTMEKVLSHVDGLLPGIRGGPS